MMKKPIHQSTGSNGGKKRCKKRELGHLPSTRNYNLKNQYVSKLFTHFGQFITHDMTYLSTTTGKLFEKYNLNILI